MGTNDNLTPDVSEALAYLQTGGLGEVFGLAEMVAGMGEAKVQMDTAMANALCIMASGAQLAPDVLTRARALLNAVTFDSDGVMVGMERRGGNGGLLSRDTIRAADELRKVLDAVRPAGSEARR